jgi:hypothetical protein
MSISEAAERQIRFIERSGFFFVDRVTRWFDSANVLGHYPPNHAAANTLSDKQRKIKQKLREGDELDQEISRK